MFIVLFICCILYSHHSDSSGIPTSLMFFVLLSAVFYVVITVKVPVYPFIKAMLSDLLGDYLLYFIDLSR